MMLSKRVASGMVVLLVAGFFVVRGRRDVTQETAASH